MIKYRIFLIFIVFIMTMGSGCSKKDSKDDDPGAPGTGDFKVPEVKDIVMYEVNLRAFGPDPGFNAVRARLDDIKKLSVNVLWLMPVHPIGGINSVNSPYSVQNYFAINPEFGTLDDLKALISEAHERDMAVIIDWVANHTAWDNPWIENKDWYTQDGSGNIVHPPGTNWQDVADLDYGNPDMRLAMIEAMKYWITEVKVDGLRCDAADWVPFDFWKQAIPELISSTERSLIFLAEGDRKDHFTAGFQMNFSWDFYSGLKNVFNGTQPPEVLYSIHQSEYSGLPENSERLRFTTNHDESAWDATPMVLFGGMDGALAASVVSIFIGGVPLIYGSQEVGVVENVPFFSQSTVNWSQNGQMLNRYENLFAYYSGSDLAKSEEYIAYSDDKVVAFSKFREGLQLFCVVNTSGDPAAFALPDELKNTQWVDVIGQEQIQLGTEIGLDSFAYMLLEK